MQQKWVKQVNLNMCGKGRAGLQRQAEPAGGNKQQLGAPAEAGQAICWSLQWLESGEAAALLPACLRRIKKICLCPAS